MTNTHPHILMEEHAALKRDNKNLTSSLYKSYKRIEELLRQIEYLEVKLATKEDQLELFSKEKLK
jgi:hypothetical protein